MKLLLSTLVAAGLATSAFAGNSDRYNDLRLDTAIGHVTDVKVQNATANTQNAPRKATISSRNSSEKSYPYINPYGIGPDNDSR